MKKVMIVASLLMLILSFSLAPVNISSANENFINNEEEFKSTDFPPYYPGSQLRDASNNGNWLGPDTLDEPTSTGNVGLDSSTAPGIASLVAAAIPGGGVVSGLMGLASFLLANGYSDVYYASYRYVNDSQQTSLEMAYVTYYYTESTLEYEYFIEAGVSYTMMHDTMPVPEPTSGE